MKTQFTQLLESVRQCRLCEKSLPLGPRPVLQIDPRARILIAGQAPGRRVHESGVPFDDPSGDRLREWLGVSRETFYNPTNFAFLPMGFCYPGTGKSGDLPPRPECAEAWRQQLLLCLRRITLTLVIGQFSQNWHLPHKHKNLTETVRAWQDYAPHVVPLPHPSPRNNIWLKRNPWFSESLLPSLKKMTQEVLSPQSSAATRGFQV
ncbi:uracil-DNA glycosylase family protein [Gammaproteobacteria bacterium]|nr:uracil-DNA glycosylase family protein [Gammaproteobacteria bacterium]